MEEKIEFGIYEFIFFYYLIVFLTMFAVYVSMYID